MFGVRGFKALTIDEMINDPKFNSAYDYHKRKLGARNLARNGFNIVAVLAREVTRKPYVEKAFLYGSNIVTNDGDIYYATKGVGATPAVNENFFAGRMEFRTGAATPAKADTYSAMTTPTTASRKVFDATYPKRNDGDADNTGAGTKVDTYLTSWTKTDFNQLAIIGGGIHDNAVPVAATKLLNHYSITSFDKTADDTLKLFVNHAMAGV